MMSIYIHTFHLHTIIDIDTSEGSDYLSDADETGMTHVFEQQQISVLTTHTFVHLRNAHISFNTHVYANALTYCCGLVHFIGPFY